MDWIERIDWEMHDGVNLAMINDITRNQFYDKILRGNVKNKNCVDIGFGTGLLSVMALRHGAAHVTAYERDYNRFQLGQHVIQKLGLEDRITLINDSFRRGLLRSLPDIDVVFHEAVSRDIWGEFLWDSICDFDGLFLPSEYRIEIHALPVTRRIAKGFLTHNTPGYFEPGVDVPNQFVKTINAVIKASTGLSAPKVRLNPGLTDLPPMYSIYRQPTAYLNLLGQDSLSASYNIDIPAREVTVQDKNQTTVDVLDLDLREVEMTVVLDPKVSDTWVIAPRAYLKHNDHILYLDRGSWGSIPAVIAHAISTNNVIVSQNVRDGKFKFTLSE